MKISKKAKLAMVGAAAAGVMAMSTTDAFAASYIPGSDIYACGGDAYLVASSSHWAYATGNGGCGGGGIGILQVNHTTGGSKIFPANTNEYFGDGVHSLQACFVTSDLSASYGCGPAVYYYG
ncbi:MAG: hypothetical protein AUG49_10890 [Catenulispora sp. 13_1_20CM_3_70_7]|nr:MAG: hypothetical protein AUG49_10890 [Catenulispora sp. 13_1_20CM_3_70_7]